MIRWWCLHSKEGMCFNCRRTLVLKHQELGFVPAVGWGNKLLGLYRLPKWPFSSCLTVWYLFFLCKTFKHFNTKKQTSHYKQQLQGESCRSNFYPEDRRWQHTHTSSSGRSVSWLFHLAWQVSPEICKKCRWLLACFNMFGHCLNLPNVTLWT